MPGVCETGVCWGSLGEFKLVNQSCPRDPITLSDDDWGVQSPPQQGI